MATKNDVGGTGPTRRLRQRSIGTRLFMYVVSGALIGLGGMSYFFYRVLEARAGAEIVGHLNVQTLLVERELARVEAATVSFSAAIKVLKRLDVKDAEAYKSLAFEFFKSRPPLVMGLGFGQIPFQIVPTTQWFYPYFYVDQGAPRAIGSFLPPPYQNVRYGELSVLDNYPEQDYFKLPLKAADKIWLEPYNWTGITLTSFYEPCFSEDGKLMAVVDADVNVTAIAAEIKSSVTQGVGYFAILSEKGNLLAFPPDPQQAKIRASVESKPSLGALWSAATSSEEGTLTDGGNFWAYRRIARTKWVMFASVPRVAIVQPVLGIALGSSLSAGVLMALAVVLFVRGLNRRLQPIVTACETLVDSNAQHTLLNESSPATAKPFIPLGEESGTDELGVLARSFDQMSRQIQESFTALERANVALEERTAFLKQLNAELLDSQKKLEAAREIADSGNRAKSEFLASMSHELRTPLNGILGYAQILLRKKTLSEDDRHGVGVVQKSGEHLLLLINDILDLAKIEARKMELTPHDVLLRPLLENVVELCRVRAVQKGISFNFVPGSDLPRAVRTDERRLRQILLNLAGNAVKFTDDGGVTLSVSRLDANKIRFRIEDTGPGLDSQQIELIFAPFEQIKQVGNEQEGTGLGLAISTKIAELMGGKIQVESTVGKGSTFWFDIDLPEVTGAVGLDENMTTSSVEGYEGPRRTLLVVDDNAVNRSLFKDTLQPLGFTVVEAANAQSGLDAAKQKPFDLIIIDLAMPGMDGLEMVRRTRLIPDHCKTPIIVSSASVFAADQDRSTDAGANDFLSKPVNTRDLFQKLEKQLSLTWIHERAGEIESSEVLPLAPAIVTPEPRADEMLMPPVNELDTLIDLVKRGRVNVIIDEVRKLEQANASYAPFAMAVGRLARAFQLKELATMLERHRAVREAALPKDGPSA